MVARRSDIWAISDDTFQLACACHSCVTTIVVLRSPASAALLRCIRFENSSTSLVQFRNTSALLNMVNYGLKRVHFSAVLDAGASSAWMCNGFLVEKQL